MKIYYWIIVIITITSSKLYAQEVRVNNSFIILVNDKLITTVSGLQLILSDTIGKKEFINGGYYPGVLYVSNIQAKNVLYTDTLKKLTLVFDNYKYKGNKQIISNYKINIDRKWFKQSLIILRIFDINKIHGTYKYSFEVPGYSFGQKLKQ